MNVELPPFLQETAAQFGAGAPYALKVLAGRLADDPDMGTPSNQPGILTVIVEGDLYEDCPDLAVGYIREPDWIQIRYVNLAPSAEPVVAVQEEDPDQEQVQPVDPTVEAVTVRQIADAWLRILRRLRLTAPDSYAALRSGAELSAIAALENDLGVRIPTELRTLWLLSAGDEGAAGWGAGCLPGNEALMTLDAVADVYRRRSDHQADHDTRNAGRPEEEQITVWRATWIPVVSRGPADSTSGLYLDTATGYLGRWSRYNDAPGEELDTLVTYLEEAADMLEAPALATRDKPGLIGGALVWRSAFGHATEDRWRRLTG
ncbi:SMI1/KNR4 family protein [Streptomyces sp. NBC_00299]|uniref:SMI1/KNR4 family protein n=1 Tax=Streptomyces sp. NBC_00299 TaxID=2975705 RepID=UPI002E282783|nr:SMI1/KNR4 family protein [Streptomyces sp. NBC_00299]